MKVNCSRATMHPWLLASCDGDAFLGPIWKGKKSTVRISTTLCRTFALPKRPARCIPGACNIIMPLLQQPSCGPGTCCHVPADPFLPGRWSLLRATSCAQIPWAKLGREPVVVEFDRLYILACPRDEAVHANGGKQGPQVRMHVGARMTTACPGCAGTCSHHPGSCGMGPAGMLVPACVSEDRKPYPPPPHACLLGQAIAVHALAYAHRGGRVARYHTSALAHAMASCIKLSHVGHALVAG